MPLRLHLLGQERHRLLTSLTLGAKQVLTQLLILDRPAPWRMTAQQRQRELSFSSIAPSIHIFTTQSLPPTLPELRLLPMSLSPALEQLHHIFPLAQR